MGGRGPRSVALQSGRCGSLQVSTMSFTQRFPKGLKVLLVQHIGGGEAPALQAEYEVTEVNSVAEAYSSLSGGGAYDVAVIEYSLLPPVEPAEVAALFRAAAQQSRMPIVLMGASPSHADVLKGIQLGAAEFLERPLAHHKVRTLWQHKIRAMMLSANGGKLPCPPSCPSLPRTHSGSSPEAAAATTGLEPLAGDSSVPMQRCMSAVTPACCPTTPLLHPAILTSFQQTSSSLNSGDSATQREPGHTPASTPEGAEMSDATSGVQRLSLQLPPAAPAVAPLPQHSASGAQSAPHPAAWPCLPLGSAWGLPVAYGIPLTPPNAAPAPPPTPPTPANTCTAPSGAPSRLAIKWCRPGTLPVPASTCDLLLPEDFNLCSTLGSQSGSGGCPRGPLGLRLTVTPDLLSGINSALYGPSRGS